MNLVGFAEKSGATQMLLVQNRGHPQKKEFKRLFQVLDAIRVEKRKLGDFVTEEKLHDAIEKYALFTIALD